MDINKFEQLAKGQLNDHPSHVDGEALWSSIQPKLEEDKRKRRGLWLWFGSGVSVIALLFIIGTNKQRNVSITSAEKMENNSETSFSSTLTTNDNLKKSHPFTESISSEDGSSTEQTLASTKKTNEKISVSSKTARSPKTPAFMDPTSFNTANEKGIKTKKESPLTNVLNNREVKNIQIKDNSSNSTNATDSKSYRNESSAITDSEYDDFKSPAHYPHVDEKKEDILLTIEPDHVDTTGTAAESTITNTITSNNSDAATPLLTSDRKINFGIALFAGVSKLHTRIETIDKNEPISKLLLDSRKATEKDLQTTSYGFQFSATTQKGLYGAVGIDYVQRTRMFEFDAAIVSYDSILGTTHIFINPFTRNILTEEGLVLQTTTTAYRKKIYNKTTLINIPLTLGYRRQMDKWMLGVETSAAFNIVTKHDGQILKNDQEFYSLNTDNDNLYQDRVQAHWRMKVFGGYQLADHLMVSAGLRYQFRTTISESTNPISEDLKGLGLELGLHMNLTKDLK